MAEGGGLLNRYTGQNLYRGFESLPLRHRVLIVHFLSGPIAKIREFRAISDCRAPETGP